MGMYTGLRCSDHPSSKELSVVKVDTRIHKVLDLGVSPNPRVGAIPLSRGIASARVGMLDPVLAIFTILSFHGTSNFARGHGGSRNEPWEATSPEDAPRREAKRTPGEEMWAWREREREIFMPSDRRCEGGVGAPPRPGSSSEQEVGSEGRHCLPHLP
jgi:hypothetical protein